MHLNAYELNQFIQFLDGIDFAYSNGGNMC